jgi:hypothetical protein
MRGTVAGALTRCVGYIYIRVKGAPKINRSQEDEQEHGEQQRKLDQSLADLLRGPARGNRLTVASETAPGEDLHIKEEE